MILYISNATDYSIYNKLLNERKINNSFQMQKFNDNLIRGLSAHDSVTALSALPYLNVSSERIEYSTNNVTYIGVKNHTGRLHKAWNILNLLFEGKTIIRDKKPCLIICDAIAGSPCYVSTCLGKKYNIPVVGIITDLPGLLDEKKDPTLGIKRMQQFDGYILLTEQMNSLVNPKEKPYMIMEGLSAPNVPNICETKVSPRIVLYTGSLWKHDAGIEYFTEGFIKANIPNCELHFYGVGELVPWIEKISEVHSNVKYMGSTTNEEIVKKQCEATLLVNPRPSGQEFCKYSFPSKTIEYMVSGTPVMMTRLPGVPEEYFQYVYTIDEENAEGVSCALTDFFIKSEAVRHDRALKAREFIIANKSCNEQTKHIWEFCGGIK